MKHILQVAGTIFVLLFATGDASDLSNKIFRALFLGSLAVLVIGGVIYKFLGRIRGTRSSE